MLETQTVSNQLSAESRPSKAKTSELSEARNHGQLSSLGPCEPCSGLCFRLGAPPIAETRRSGRHAPSVLAIRKGWGPVIPVNVAAEKSVLGACVECVDILRYAIAEGLTPEDFTGDHPRVFRSLLEMREKRIPIDSLSLAEYLGNTQNDYVLVSDLICGAIIHPSHVIHDARIVRQKSRLRSLLTPSDWIAREAGSPCADPDEIIKRACEKLEPAGTPA
jgi:hypothetical protein